MVLSECNPYDDTQEGCVFSPQTTEQSTPTGLPSTSEVGSIIITAESSSRSGTLTETVTLTNCSTFTVLTLHSHVIPSSKPTYDHTLPTNISEDSSTPNASPPIGIVILGVLVPIAVIALLVSLFFWKRRRRGSHSTKVVESDTQGGSYHELDAERNVELDASTTPKPNTEILIAELGTPSMTDSTRHEVLNIRRIDLDQYYRAASTPPEPEFYTVIPEPLPVGGVYEENILMSDEVEGVEARGGPVRVVKSLSAGFGKYIPYFVDAKSPLDNNYGDLLGGVGNSFEDSGGEYGGWSWSRRGLETGERIQRLEELNNEEAETLKRIQKRDQTAGI